MTVLRREDNDLQRAFLDACAHGHADALRRVLVRHQEWVNVNARMGRTGDTGLHIASEKGHISVVKFLLGFEGKNLNPNIENDEGSTPLALAARGGHRTIVRALLKARNLKLKANQVKKVLKEVFSGDSIDFEIAKMVINEYKTREGREFDTALTAHVDRCAELVQRAGLEARRSLASHKKEIQKWLDSTLLSKKPRQEIPQSKTRDELLQDLKDHCECGMYYEEYAGGEVWACANDHWTCRACGRKMTRARSSVDYRCPTCRSDFDCSPPARRHTAEKVLSPNS